MQPPGRTWADLGMSLWSGMEAGKQRRATDDAEEWAAQGDYDRAADAVMRYDPSMAQDYLTRGRQRAEQAWNRNYAGALAANDPEAVVQLGVTQGRPEAVQAGQQMRAELSAQQKEQSTRNLATYWTQLGDIEGLPEAEQAATFDALMQRAAQEIQAAGGDPSAVLYGALAPGSRAPMRAKIGAARNLIGTLARANGIELPEQRENRNLITVPRGATLFDPQSGQALYTAPYQFAPSSRAQQPTVQIPPGFVRED